MTQQRRSLKSKINKPVRLLNSKEKIIAYLLIGLFVFLFLVFFQPFGIISNANQDTISQDFVFYMLVLGTYVSLVLIFNDAFLFNWIFRKLILRWQLILWLLWTLLFLSTMVFLLYNLLGNWQDLSWSSWMEFIGSFTVTAIIPLVILFLYARMKHYEKLTETMQDFEMDATELITLSPTGHEEGALNLTLDSLLYLEADNKAVIIYYTKSDQLHKTRIRLSLKGIDEMQLHPALVRCHRSFMVNLYHLDHFSGNQHHGHIWLNEVDTPIPVSSTYSADVMKKLQ